MKRIFTFILAAVSLKLGILPAAISGYLSLPHDFLTRRVFQPMYEYALGEESLEINHAAHRSQVLGKDLFASQLPKGEDSSDKLRAYRYAHRTTDFVGWTSFAYFVVPAIVKAGKRRNS